MFLFIRTSSVSQDKGFLYPNNFRLPDMQDEYEGEAHS